MSRTAKIIGLILLYLFLYLTRAQAEFIESPNQASGDVDSHQGFINGGGYYYTIDTDAIYKWNKDWTPTGVSNTDPFNGVANVNHLGSGCYYNGKLYIPMEEYNSVVDYGDESIAIFDADDLTRDSVTATTEVDEIAALTIVSDVIYVISFVEYSTIWKYDRDTLAYEGTETLSAGLTQKQGITYKDSKFWITNSSNNGLYSCDIDGANLTLVHVFDEFGLIEGLDVVGTGFGILDDPGAVETVHFFRDVTGVAIDGVTLEGVTIE